MKKFSFLLLILLLGVPSSHALKIGGHVKATLVSEDTAIQPGTPFWVAVRLEMAPHWHTYWKNPGESGEATQIQWKLPDGYKAGEIRWPVPKKFMVPPVVVYGYEEDVLLMVPITPPSVVTNSKPVTLNAHVNWLECEVECIPGEGDVALTLPIKIEPAKKDKTWGPRFNDTRAQWPLENSEWSITAKAMSKGYRVLVTPPANSKLAASDLSFFAEDPDVIAYAAPQTFEKSDSAYALELVKSEASTETAKQLRGVLINTSGWRGVPTETALAIDVPVVAPKPLSAPTTNISFLFALVFSFVGGLILNLMPCVLPVLSIKVLGFVSHAKSGSRHALLHALVFSLGIVNMFWLLSGALLLFRAGGAQLGWGFQLQNPYIVGGLAMLFVFLGLNMMGLFEVGTSFLRLADTNSATGYFGSYLNGVLATIVATPCTAPFMGSALGFALTQSWPAAIAIFTSLGVGMAFPYIVLSAFPVFLKFVPKPGPWMIKLKRIMGILLLGTAAWLAWVLSLQLSHKSTASEQWQVYSEERIQDERAHGRPVFVDFSAAWCLTCQVNERLILNTDNVQKAFREKNVTLLKGDWTSHDEKITKALEQFGRNGVPFYVFYPSDPSSAPSPLPDVLTQQIVLDAISKIK